MSQATGCPSHLFTGQGQPGLHHPADARSARKTRAAGDAQEEKAERGMVGMVGDLNPLWLGESYKEIWLWINTYKYHF